MSDKNRFKAGAYAKGSRAGGYMGCGPTRDPIWMSNETGGRYKPGSDIAMLYAIIVKRVKTTEEIMRLGHMHTKNLQPANRNEGYGGGWNLEKRHLEFCSKLNDGKMNL